MFQSARYATSGQTTNIRLIDTGVSATEKDRGYGFVGGLVARTRLQAGRREGVEGAKGGQGGRAALKPQEGCTQPGRSALMSKSWPAATLRRALACLGVPLSQPNKSQHLPRGGQSLQLVRATVEKKIFCLSCMRG